MNDSKEILRDAVREFLEDGPLKGTELLVKLVTFAYENNIKYKNFDPIVLVNQMRNDGEIIEVEYTLPKMPYRSKSLYFIKGSEITL